MPSGPKGDPEPEVQGVVPPLSLVALDDDADFCAYIADLLEQDGHDIRTASTPADAYTLCAERLPDILLLDIKMGRYSGEEVLAEIRQRWPRLCVIVVTGYPTLENMRQTFKQDVFDYLAKPFSVADIRTTLAQAAAAYGLGERPQDRLRQDLGRQVRLARTEKGWTLRQLSDNSGVSVSQLSSIERGAHLPSLESLLAIASALGIRPSVWLDHSGF
jgi:DNA-binding NtrC family response regulator